MIISAGALVFFAFQLQAAAEQQLSGDEIYRNAQELEQQGYYKKARELYLKAENFYSEKGNLRRVDSCRISRQQIEKILIEYPYSKGEVLKLLEEAFPELSEEERNDWAENKVLSRTIDGEKHYFENFIENLKFRNIKLMRADARFYGPMESFFDKYNDIVFKDSHAGYSNPSWQPYVNRVVFLGDASLNIPRGKLPGKGILQLWLPLPIKTSAQDGIRIISLTPEEYVKLPPSIDGDIGLAYMEIDLQELKKDLEIKLLFTFSHYEQNFNIDPNKIGQYDYDGEFYRKYTASRGNTNITPEIAEKAKNIIEGEENPYFAVKKIYDYVIDNVSYSVIPHLTFDVLEIPESEFVHKNHFGDCGAQSLYFVSLCRSLGIPARTCGGWQLCPGYESCHFWAEFYLPNYGWVPADISLGQIANYLPDITKEQKTTFRDFFFCNQDPYRWTIQNDIDLPLQPVAEEPIFLKMAVQYPAVICKDSKKNLAFEMFDHWKFKLHPVYR